MSAPLLPTTELRAFHDAANRAWFERNAVDTPPHETPLWTAIARNHDNNMRLWAEEDLARRRLAPDAEIVANKRHIDAFNQARNDAIEQCDDLLLAAIRAERGADPSDPRLNSETAGSIVDRLSIASLKRYHMGRQLLRTDSDAAHLQACADRLARLEEQTTDLLDCLDALLADCIASRARFKTYRQFKMYNDPDLNPQLVRERQAGQKPGEA